MRVGHILILAAATLCSAVPAVAKEKADPNDPNRIICEKQEVLGSRLATKKVCMTAAEWKEQRAQDRQAIEKGQMEARGPSGS
jgi:predicted secreted protein